MSEATDKAKLPDADHKAKEANKHAAAMRECPRMARRGFDPQMSRAFAELDG